MKQFFMLTLIASLILSTSCSKEDSKEKELVYKWHLIESLNDPGDGSGVFEKVESDAIIEFYDDNTVLYTENLCMNGTSYTGKYSLLENKIYPDCRLEPSLNFRIENNQLIIYYPCVEGCAEKFELVEKSANS